MSKIITADNIAKRIDHTLLDIEASDSDIATLCDEAVKYGFRAVCIRPEKIRFAKTYLPDNVIEIATVIGFPSEKRKKGLNPEEIGNMDIDYKVRETIHALEHGATELDIVVNIAKIMEGNYGHIRQELGKIRKAAGEVHIKAILETGLYHDMPEVLREVCITAFNGGADTIKTSTGYGTTNAKTDAVAIMRSITDSYSEHTQLNYYVKASGGIRDYSRAAIMIQAGADILGTSSGVKIIEEARGIAEKISTK